MSGGRHRGRLLIARRSAAAVRAIGGTERSGQAEMADAVADAFDTGTHLLVQAGTGTGKSLGYLVPALTWLTQHPGERIVVATATLALQSQLADKDIPVALDAVEQVTGHRPVHAILKGRTNYACLLRVRRPFCSSGHLAVRRRAGRDNAIVDTRRTRIRAWRRGRRAAGMGRRAGNRRRACGSRFGTVAYRTRLAAGFHPCSGVSWGPALPVRGRMLRREIADAARAADLIVTNHALLAINATRSTAPPSHHR